MVTKICLRFGTMGATDESATELTPMVIVPLVGSWQLGGFVVEDAFGKMPVMTKQVSPQPKRRKQRSSAAHASEREPECE
jgi:hypothetical protein